MRILVTGASGFIGREACAEAVRRGHQVLAIVRGHAGGGLPPEVATASGSLESVPWQEIGEFMPDAVLHLAWITQPGVYLHSDENERLLEASREFLGRCLAMGVSHIAVAGTCLEYQSAAEPLDEETSALADPFPYVRAKRQLWNWLKVETAGGLTAASWLRIFYPYGPGEHERRLPTLIMRQLATGQKIQLRTPDSVKDYVYVTDLASAICEVLEHRLAGPVNLGSGAGIRIHDLALKIARAMNVESSLVEAAPVPDHDPWPHHVAGMSRLENIGWKPQVSVDDGVHRLLASLSLPVA